MTLILAQEERMALLQIDELIETYCKECLLKTHLRETKGKTKAHQYCITKCSVGMKIKQLGNTLQ